MYEQVLNEDYLNYYQKDSGSFIDTRDGSEYRWVRIGDQIWMAENLALLPKVDPYSKGSDPFYTNDSLTLISTYNDDEFYYVYDYSPYGTYYDYIPNAKATYNYQEYGVLYNISAALQGEDQNNYIQSGIQGVCPDGWHLPSANEFGVLIKFLGGGTESGKKLKEAGTMHWTEDFGADNQSGFTARPAGLRDNDHYFVINPGEWELYPAEFKAIGEYTMFWSSTQCFTCNDDNGKPFFVLSIRSTVAVGAKDGDAGGSVRCVKD